MVRGCVHVRVHVRVSMRVSARACVFVHAHAHVHAHAAGAACTLLTSYFLLLTSYFLQAWEACRSERRLAVQCISRYIASSSLSSPRI